MLRAGAMWCGLLLIVGLANAAIMVMELAASQLVARYLGQSLYTWTAIIGTALTGMAFGHLLGGWLAERVRNISQLLGGLLLLTAPACLAVLFTNTLAGNWPLLQQSSWPWRITCHVGITFFIPFLLIGALNPVAARLALQWCKGAGQAVGSIYALAAAGSIAGVFLTGFYGVPRYPIPQIYLSMAVVLGSLGVIVLVGQRLLSESLATARLTRPKVEAALWQGRPNLRYAEPNGVARAIPYALWPILLTAFLSNAAIFIFELSISRMVTRHFGHGLYTWTLVLGTVLAGLTLGNLIGGRLADRYPSRPLLGLLLGLCALACVGAPGLDTELRSWTVWAQWSWPWPMSWHILLLGMGVSFVLGMIGPTVAKHALEQGDSPGLTLGRVYAAGALGSVAGVFIAGYGLIAWLGPYATVLCLALVLALAAWRYQPPARVGGASVLLALSALALGLAPSGVLRDMGSALGLHGPRYDHVIYEAHSHYAWIAVQEDPRTPGRRKLVLDSLVHSEAHMEAPEELLFRFWWIYEMALETRWPSPAPLHGMVIGGGGYVFPRFMELTRPGSYIEAVEIDPGVTQAAHAAFGFPRDSAVKVLTMDGRNRVSELLDAQAQSGAESQFDYIIGDSIDQYSVPFQLTTVEFKEMVRALLKPEGVYLLNTTDRIQSGRFLGAVLHSAQQVFPHVTAISNRPLHVSDRDSIIVICSNTPIDAQRIVERIRSKYPSFPGAVLPETEVARLVEKAGHRLLRDNYAPLDYLIAYISDPDPVPSFEAQEQTYLQRLERVRVDIASGRLEGADITLDSIATFMPWQPKLYVAQAELYIAQEQYSEALSALDQAIALAPFRKEFHTFRDEIQQKLSYPDALWEDTVNALATNSIPQG